MKTVKYIIFFFLLNSSAYSQTIINAERLIDGVDSTIYAISLSYNGTKGNSNTDQLAVSPSIILLRKKNEYKLFGGYNLLSESSKTILKGGYIHFRHNYKISERVKTFEFYQLQFNDVLLLTKREVFGAGFRFNLINKDSLKSNFNIGLMRELEILNKSALGLNEISETKYFRATTLFSIKWIFGKLVKIDNVIYYQPYLKDFYDYRILNDFRLTSSITNHFELVTSLTTRYDSKPPGSLEKLDNVISFGLNVKF